MRALPIVCAALLSLVAASVSGAEFQSGVEYEQLPIPVDTIDPKKIEVVEVFSYGCVHCKDFDPALEAWREAQSSDVVFRRVPAIFSDQFSYLAQVFYAAEALGVTDKVHAPIFAAIHDRHEDLRDPNLLAAIFTQHAGVSGEELIKVLNSFSVRSRVQQADGYGRMYRVSGVPSLVVNGKYRIDGKMAGSNTRMLQVADWLVERERTAPAAAPAAASTAPAASKEG